LCNHCNFSLNIHWLKSAYTKHLLTSQISISAVIIKPIAKVIFIIPTAEKVKLNSNYLPCLPNASSHALDVTGGRVVKGVNFVELRDAGEPVEIAARYNEQGADELTFLDITATSDARDMILHIIEAVASQVSSFR
jgi:hypothetical protein